MLQGIITQPQNANTENTAELNSEHASPKSCFMAILPSQLEANSAKTEPTAQSYRSGVSKS